MPLEELGVVWCMSLEQQWDRGFALLAAFSEREGHCKVPKPHMEKGLKLGRWLSEQRAAHNKGTLYAARQSQLEELGVV